MKMTGAFQGERFRMLEVKPALEDKHNIASQIYDRIKSDIVELRLEPGAYFLEKEIAEALGTSRTPVREAAKRLEQEGWIFWESYRKARVKELTMESGREIFQLRRMIEPFCIDCIFQQGKSRVLAGKLDFFVQEMNEQRHDWYRFIHSDVRYHSTIVDEVGNAHLMRIWQSLSSEITRIAVFAKNEHRNTAQVIKEHNDLLQALWDMDREKTMARLASHYESISHFLEEKLLSAK